MARFVLTRGAVEKALIAHRGNILRAAESIGCDRSTLHKYITTHDMRGFLDDCREIILDIAESNLYARVQDDDYPATVFLLKTIGKRRGYVERSESISQASQVVRWVEDDDDDER